MTFRIAAVLLSFLTMLSTPLLAADVPDLVGDWQGPLSAGGLYYPPRVEEPTFYSALDLQIVITMSVTGQDGRSFHGLMGNHADKEIVVGVVRADNRTLLMTDNDGYKTATMLTPTTMEYCVQVAEEEHRVSACGILEKQ